MNEELIKREDLLEDPKHLLNLPSFSHKLPDPLSRYINIVADVEPHLPLTTVCDGLRGKGEEPDGTYPTQYHYHTLFGYG